LAAFILNDWFDIESDSANNRKDRPLVSGEINSNTAVLVSTLLYLFGLLFSAFAGIIPFLVALAFSIFSALYNWKLKKMPLVGNLFIALSMSISFVYGNLCVSPSLVFPVILFSCVSFLFGFGRELIITLRDVEGDKKAGATTLPMILGAKTTATLASLSIFCSIPLMFFPLTYSFSIVYLACVLLTAFFGLATIYSVVSSLENESLKRARNLSLVGMGLGVLSFLALAF